MKKITAGVVINGGYEQYTIELQDQEAELLVSLYQQAQDSILQGIEDADKYLTFDPWLKEQNPDLYEKALAAFHAAMTEELGANFAMEPMLYEDMYVHIPMSFDDCYYLEDKNEILFDFFIHESS